MEDFPGDDEQGRLQVDNICIQPLVKTSLHAVISKDFKKTKVLLMKPTLLPEIPLQLRFGTGDFSKCLRIKFALQSTNLLKQVRIYGEQVIFKTKDAQGKECNITHNCEKLILLNYTLSASDLVSVDNVFHRAKVDNPSSDIGVEVKIILLEAIFRVINDIAIPPCNFASLTMQDLIIEERFTDVKIAITAEQEAAPPVHFFAHESVLVARSPVCAKMFEHNLQESATSSITVSDIRPEVFKEALSFIYTNQVPHLNTMAPQLLYAAEKYQLDDLKARCEQFLSYNLQVSNAVETLQLVQTYNAGQLKDNASRFILEFIDEVRESKDWEIIESSSDLMATLLSRVEPAAKRPKAN